MKRKNNNYPVNFFDIKKKRDKNLNYPYQSGPNGLFIQEFIQESYKNIYQTDSCREIFGQRFTKDTPLFYFKVHEELDMFTISSFIRDVEKKLKLNPSDRIVFNTMNCSDIMEVIVSPWWRENLLRRQLLTALMRAALSNGNTFYQKIKKSKYFRREGHLKAFKTFLQGKTATNLSLSNYKGWSFRFGREDSYKFLVNPSTLGEPASSLE